jgi:Cu-Zn family superoxide dismutase
MNDKIRWSMLAAVSALIGCAPDVDEPQRQTQTADRPADNRIAPEPTAPPATPVTPAVPRSTSVGEIVARADIEPLGDATARGTIEFHETGTGLLTINVMLTGLDAGPHGFHVHEGTDCTQPGEHFNPQGAPHGAPTAAGAARHRGDLGNVTADDTGTVQQPIRDSLLATDRGFIGKPIVVHKGQDDLQSQPGGDSGDPVACGIIEPADGRRDVSQTPDADRGV